MPEQVPPIDQQQEVEEQGGGIDLRSKTSLDSEEIPESSAQSAEDSNEWPAAPQISAIRPNSWDQASTQAIAQTVALQLQGVEFGKYLPEELPREKRERIIKAEAMWISGVNSPDEIAKIAGVSKTTIYAWCASYHWRKRADIAQLGQEALRAASMVTIAAKARAAAADAKALSDEKADIKARADARHVSRSDPDIVDLLAERGTRPMPEEEAARRTMIEQAVSDAHQDSVISLYVEAISKIVGDQQELTNMLVAHGTEMAKDLHLAYTQWKALKPKNTTPKEIRDEISKQLPLYRQLVSAINQAISLQRRVWMIADASKTATFDDFGDGSGMWEANERIPKGGASGAAVPVQRGTYEENVIAAETKGIDLTKDQR